jgi:hypothetical protein
VLAIVSGNSIILSEKQTLCTLALLELFLCGGGPHVRPAILAQTTPHMWGERGEILCAF